MECSSKCSQEPNCLSLVYDKFYASCHLFNVIYVSDDNGDINYWVLETRSTRWGPKSCTDISKCSGITRDGEFWIYPPAANGKRTKIYCHNMSTEPSHFVTLKNNNSFIIHDETNFLFAYVLNNKCKSSFNPPLKMVEFSKVKVQIEDMLINRTDLTFTTTTGSYKFAYGGTADCNGEDIINTCHHFGKAIINTRGTGLIVDPTLAFGATGFRAKTYGLLRSVDGAEISYGCAGFCGYCGPSRSVRLEHTREFISVAEAKAIVCQY